jgi:hypothetical protein
MEKNALPDEARQQAHKKKIAQYKEKLAHVDTFIEVGQFTNTVNTAETTGELLTGDFVDLAEAIANDEEDNFWGKYNEWGGAADILMSLWSFGKLWQSIKNRELSKEELADFVLSQTNSGTQFANFLGTKTIDNENTASTFASNCGWVLAPLGIVIGIKDSVSAAKDAWQLHHVGKRWEVIAPGYARGGTFKDTDIMGVFKACVDRIGRRKFRTEMDGVSAASGVGTSIITIVGMVGAVGAAATPIGWILFGSGVGISVMLKGYKGVRRLKKQHWWKTGKEKLKDGMTPAPFWCKTEGDYFRFAIAKYIYEGVLDSLPNPKANLLAKQFAWVLFGGDTEYKAATAEATKLGLAGIIGFIKG